MTIAVISMIRDEWGGSEELWASMAEEALKQGHAIIHLSYDVGSLHPRMKDLQAKGLKVMTRPSYRKSAGNSLNRMLKRIVFFLKKRLNRSVDQVFEARPDVVLYNGTTYSIADEKKLLNHLRKKNIPFFILGHFNNEKGSQLSPTDIDNIKYAYNRSEKVLFISNRSIETAKRELGVDIPNAEVVRNPVNMEDTAVLPYPSTGNGYNLATVGNLRIAHKGQDILLNVLSQNNWKDRNWHLNIFGAGEDRSHLESLVQQLNLGSLVTFHGKVRDIRKLWKENHLLIMPSLMEGMPLAVVEAMLCGRPALVTDVGGHREWINEGEEGFIAEAATMSSISNAMERAWNRREQWEQMGWKAHNKAMSLYDPQPGKTLLRILTEKTD